MGTLTALAIIQQSLATASAISALMATRHGEGKAITMEDLNGLVADDDLAKAALDSAIKKVNPPA